MFERVPFVLFFVVVVVVSVGFLFVYCALLFVCLFVYIHFLTYI